MYDKWDNIIAYWFDCVVGYCGWIDFYPFVTCFGEWILCKKRKII
jgi:hypothetical protein